MPDRPGSELARSGRRGNRPSPPADGGPLLTLPNALTLLRVVLVPVILWLLVAGTPATRWWAFGIFVFAAVTDTVDGWAARRFAAVTRWGQLADPLADKVLVGGSLMSLAAVGRLPWWAVLVIAAREIGISLLRVGLLKRRDVVMPASAWGKGKTLLQVLAVAAFLLPGAPAALRWTLLYAAVALTLLSGLDYAVRGVRLVRMRDPERVG